LLKLFVNDPPKTVIAEHEPSTIVINKHLRIVPRYGLKFSYAVGPTRFGCFGRAENPPTSVHILARRKPVL
jgi:hypothetical protein